MRTGGLVCCHMGQQCPPATVLQAAPAVVLTPPPSSPPSFSPSLQHRLHHQGPAEAAHAGPRRRQPRPGVRPASHDEGTLQLQAGLDRRCKHGQLTLQLALRLGCAVGPLHQLAPLRRSRHPPASLRTCHACLQAISGDKLPDKSQGPLTGACQAVGAPGGLS